MMDWGSFAFGCLFVIVAEIVGIIYYASTRGKK